MTKFIKSWLDEVWGATAIEFALVAFPFIMLMVGIVEVSLMFTSAVLLEGGTSVASRLIRTCQIQDMGGDPEINFINALCGHASLIGCSDNILVESIVMPDDSFSSVADYQPVYDHNGVFVPSGFDPGGDSEVVLIRAYYNYPIITPFFSQLMGGFDGRVPFMSTVVLQIEPCDFEV